jgi:hypothetical protein
LLSLCLLTAACDKKADTATATPPATPDAQQTGAASAPEPPKADEPKAEAPKADDTTIEPPAIGTPFKKLDVNAAFKSAWVSGDVKAICAQWAKAKKLADTNCLEITVKTDLNAKIRAVGFSIDIPYDEEEGGMGGHMDGVIIVGGEELGYFYDAPVSAHNGGVGYAGGDAGIKSIEVKEVADKGLPELIVISEENSYDGDTSENTSDTTDLRFTGVVQVSSNNVRWRMLANTYREDGVHIMLDDDDLPKPELGPPTIHEMRLTWFPDKGQVDVMRLKGAEPLIPVGTFALKDMPQREESQ